MKESVIRTIRTEIEIAAPASAVWKVLTDFAEHPRWNPSSTRIEGPLTKGARLSVRFRGRWHLRPKVTRIEPGRTLEWLGRLMVPGIFKGRHRFELQERGDKTWFVQSERFSGVLVPFLVHVLRETETGFHEMNAALAEEVARRGAAGQRASAEQSEAA